MLPIIRFIVAPSDLPINDDNLNKIYEKAVAVFNENASTSIINKDFLHEWLISWLKVMCKVHSSNPPLLEGTWDEYYVSSQYSTNSTKFDIKAMVLFTKFDIETILPGHTVIKQ